MSLTNVLFLQISILRKPVQLYFYYLLIPPYKVRILFIPKFDVTFNVTTTINLSSNTLDLSLIEIIETSSGSSGEVENF